jgi:hypothetical protein
MGAELAKAKIQVMRQVPYIQKGSSPGLKYTFAGEAAFVEKLHPAMIDAGLEIAPHDMEVLHQEVYTTSGGSKMNRVLVKVRYTLTHAGSGESQVICTVGEGADSGDKASNKAMTAAYKYALRQAFLIETGNDPDETPSEQQQRASRGRPNPPSGSSPAPRQPADQPTVTGVLKQLAAKIPATPNDFYKSVAWASAKLAAATNTEPTARQSDMEEAITQAMGAGDAWQWQTLTAANVTDGYAALLAYVRGELPKAGAA